MAEEIEIFEKTLHPLDLKVIYNYFPTFYTALFAMSEYSELITKLFIDKKYNGQYFRVRLYHNMVWKDIYLDCYFPHLPNDQTCFTEISFNMIWPQVLEKAFAKMLGSYQAISYSPLQNVLTDLIGYPVEVSHIRVKSTSRLRR